MNYHRVLICSSCYRAIGIRNWKDIFGTFTRRQPMPFCAPTQWPTEGSCFWGRSRRCADFRRLDRRGRPINTKDHSHLQPIYLARKAFHPCSAAVSLTGSCGTSLRRLHHNHPSSSAASNLDAGFCLPFPISTPESALVLTTSNKRRRSRLALYPQPCRNGIGDTQPRRATKAKARLVSRDTAKWCPGTGRMGYSPTATAFATCLVSA